MTKLILYFSTLLTWVAFEPGFYRQRRGNYQNAATEFSLLQDQTELQQKKIRRRRLDVIPKSWGCRKIKIRSKCNYKGTKSKDVRDSNQRKIRRKFNNM